jgi:outer membrane lipoprotein carrier protein
MGSTKVRFLLWIAVLLISIANAGAQDRVHEIADAVDHHYNDLRTLEAQFTEAYRGGGVSRDESGTLWLKRPGKMRWEYQKPQEKLFVSNGKEAWFYVPGERQARRTPAKKLNDVRSPLAYLLGKTKLEKEFSGLSLAPDAKPAESGDVMLRGVPKFMDQVEEVLLEITPSRQINRIVVQSADGSTTEYHFVDEKENGAIADAKFQFSPPAGVEIMEAEIGE